MFSETKENLKLKNNEALFLIDDYIGSGETLNFCLDELRVNPSISNDKINIISLASQNEIYEKLKAEGVKFKLDTFSTPVCKMAVIIDSEGNALTLHQLHETRVG